MARAASGVAISSPKASISARTFFTSDGANTIMGVIAERSFRGSRTRLTIQHASGQLLEFEINDLVLPTAGEPITLALRRDRNQRDSRVSIPIVRSACFKTTRTYAKGASRLQQHGTFLLLLVIFRPAGRKMTSKGIKIHILRKS